MLIVYEGLHGCGKSTQLSNLKEWLINLNKEVVTTSWNSYPGLNEFNGKLKDTNAITPKSSSLIHALDFTLRYEQIIQPALNEKKIVLADRYIHTAYVRDGLRGVSKSLLDHLYEDTLQPDLIIFLDITPQEAINRSKDINFRSNYILGKDLNFNIDVRKNFSIFLEKQREVYKSLLKNKENALIIDANLEPEDIFQIIIKHLKKINMLGD